MRIRTGKKESKKEEEVSNFRLVFLIPQIFSWNCGWTEFFSTLLVFWNCCLAFLVLNELGLFQKAQANWVNFLVERGICPPIPPLATRLSLTKNLHPKISTRSSHLIISNLNDTNYIKIKIKNSDPQEWLQQQIWNKKKAYSLLISSLSSRWWK